MQVCAFHCGKDVLQPSEEKTRSTNQKSCFLSPASTSIGSAYLYILPTRYLVKVTTKVSQEYSMISRLYKRWHSNVLENLPTATEQERMYK